MLQEAYTRGELASLPTNATPERGPVCPKCGNHIPQFADLRAEDETRIRKLIRGDQKILAAKELIFATRCPISWAKIWIIHSGHPDAIGTNAPCPYCGKPLKTALAKQCPHCNMDWHNADKPKRLDRSE